MKLSTERILRTDALRNSTENKLNFFFTDIQNFAIFVLKKTNHVKHNNGACWNCPESCVQKYCTQSINRTLLHFGDPTIRTTRMFKLRSSSRLRTCVTTERKKTPQKYSKAPMTDFGRLYLFRIKRGCHWQRRVTNCDWPASVSGRG